MKIFKYSLLWILCAILWSCEDTSPVTYDFDFSGIKVSTGSHATGHDIMHVTIPASNRKCFYLIEMDYGNSEVELNLETGQVTGFKGEDGYGDPIIENLPDGSLSITCHFKHYSGNKIVVIRLYYIGGTYVEKSFIQYPPASGGYWDSYDTYIYWLYKL